MIFKCSFMLTSDPNEVIYKSWGRDGSEKTKPVGCGPYECVCVCVCVIERLFGST
jgi:hypothetical protein